MNAIELVLLFALFAGLFVLALCVPLVVWSVVGVYKAIYEDWRHERHTKKLMKGEP